MDRDHRRFFTRNMKQIKEAVVLEGSTWHHKRMTMMIFFVQQLNSLKKTMTAFLVIILRGATWEKKNLAMTLIVIIPLVEVALEILKMTSTMSAHSLFLSRATKFIKKKRQQPGAAVFFWMVHWWVLGHASHFGLDGSFRVGTSSAGLQIRLTSNPDLHWLF